MRTTDDYFIHFDTPIDGIPLPEKFTYPFYYEPHPIAIQAAEQLQEYLNTQNEWVHNFGLERKDAHDAIGKMFGVLVVKDTRNEIGFLSAFSGKLAEGNFHRYFVPPVYDTLDEEGFYKQGESTLNRLTTKIQELESSVEYITSKKNLLHIADVSEQAIAARRALNRRNKHTRKQLRKSRLALMSSQEYQDFLERMSKESIRDSYILKDLIRECSHKVEGARHIVDQYEQEIESLKKERKALSGTLQHQLHKQYRFLDAEGAYQDLLDIFKSSSFPTPPAGAGECAAPKLLQYAYDNEFVPIALAEFWWGVSPKSEIRNHKHYYPACRGKCLPILSHMLTGLDVDENPLLKSPELRFDIEVLYEDEHIVILNKPHEFLSVPGKNIQDSVLVRMKEKYPDATGPLLVHRLDMSTSGILVMAKDMRSHRILQQQFIKKTIKKIYVAVLDGEVAADYGYVDLPLRVDLNDRPRQVVCFEHGKAARTRYEVISRLEGKTRIRFFPITGRTHQLRVHAAHSAGLSMPIVGDDLYGTKQDRLYLHASSITLVHPHSKEEMEFTCSPPF